MMTEEDLRRLEIAERIAFQRGHQTAFAGEGAYQRSVYDLVNSGFSDESPDPSDQIEAAFARGHAYGTRLLEQDRE
jgi:hypothetical protein